MISKFSPECSFAIGSKPGMCPSTISVLGNIIEEDIGSKPGMCPSTISVLGNIIEEESDGGACGFTASECDELLAQGEL